MEFKGSSTCWQNTFRTSSDVSTKTTVVNDPYGSWHHYKAWINRVSSTDVTIDYYIDGTWTARHTANFTGKPMWLIIDFQTEGSSGSPAAFTDKYLYGGTIEVGYIARRPLTSPAWVHPQTAATAPNGAAARATTSNGKSSRRAATFA
jgi:hypothetical protein